MLCLTKHSRGHCKIATVCIKVDLALQERGGCLSAQRLAALGVHLSHHRECPLAPSRTPSRTIENALSHHRECPLAPWRMSFRTIENVLSHHRESPLAPSRMSSRTIENALSHHRECPLATSRMPSRTIENALPQSALLCGELRSLPSHLPTTETEGRQVESSGRSFWNISWRSLKRFVSAKL